MNHVAVRALVLVLLACSLPVAAAAAGAPATVSSQSTASDTLATVDEPPANETPRHQNPDEYDEGGDDEELESWLEDQLASQLQDSTIALNEGQYDQARDRVGDDYDERLEQYVEVAGETGDEDDPAEAYRNASEEQERMADTVEEYERTQEEYEEALAAGDEERAHELARELEELYDEIDEAGDNAVTSYETITTETDQDLSDAAESVEETRSAVDSDQMAIREEQFVETELDLEVVDESASFDDPLVVRGEVRTEDGSPVEEDELQILVEDDPVDLDAPSADWWADDDEQFEFEYRPTDLDLDADTVTVEYVPDSDTTYLGSEAELEVSPEQTTATIDEFATTGEASYGEPLSVSGEVTAAGVPVDDVPVAITVDGELLGTTNTTDGEFAGEVPVPANVSDGEGTVTAALPFEDQALTATPAEAPVTVTETDTELTASVTAIGEEEIAVDGSFQTADGEPLANQTLEVRIDGVTADTVETDADGEIADTVETGSVDDEVTVTVTYDEVGSNLATAEAESTVAMPGSGDSLAIPQSVVIGLGALLGVGMLGLAGWWRRRSRRAERDRAPAAAVAGTAPDTDPVATRDRVDALLEQADDRRAAGRHDTAVRTAYAAVRQAYGSALGRPGAATHWEFYRKHAADDATDAEALRELVGTYELAAFTVDPVTEDQSARVLALAQQLCDEADIE